MRPTSRFHWRHQYDPDRDELEGNLAATVNDDEDLTQQSFKDDADINILARRFGLDKQPLPVEAVDPRYYGDLTDVPDLRTVLDIANDAKNKFMELPANLRARFYNQPALLWDFVNDPDNADECVRLGLLVRPPDPHTPTGSDTPEPEQTPKPSLGVT